MCFLKLARKYEAISKSIIKSIDIKSIELLKYLIISEVIIIIIPKISDIHSLAKLVKIKVLIPSSNPKIKA